MTIYALSSAPGRAGVAVVRVSGPSAGATIEALTGRAPGSPRRALVRRISEPGTGVMLDRALVLWFPGPASVTGEDVAEFHVHGGPAVIAAVLRALSGVPGLRPAEAGEFTRRAFENGKLDLTEVEGLADLIAAETEHQRRLALRQTEGELGRLYDSWRQRLVSISAHFEALIDFPDETPAEGTGGGSMAAVAALRQDMAEHLADGRRGERLRDGLSVVILGAPNVGKSTLLNSLARRDAAIVSETAGTTRDVIEVHLDLGGYPVIVADTAGLRSSSDEIESEGVRRALARAARADLKIVVLSAPAEDSEMPGVEATDEDSLWVLNKVDVVEPGVLESRLKGLARRGIADPIVLSLKTGEGLEGLVDRLTAEVGGRFSTGAGIALTRERHRREVAVAEAALGRFEDGRREGLGAELAAEEIRLAVRALGRVTGRVDVEEILDVVFRDFCIGK